MMREKMLIKFWQNYLKRNHLKSRRKRRIIVIMCCRELVLKDGERKRDKKKKIMYARKMKGFDFRV
jgi:hypothetical protein